MAAARRLLPRALALAAIGVIALPATASAHRLIGRYESPLPLAAYLAGAAVAVGLSFVIVIFRGRADADAVEREAEAARRGPVVGVPRALQLGGRALGLLAWLWIVAQGLVAGSGSDADVGSLFLWTYGWVAIPIISAVLAPVWEWLDPFATLHDLGAAALRRLGVGRDWKTAAYPSALATWPAVAAFIVFVWLELVYTSARGGRVLVVAVLLYTGWTLAMMAQYGRDTWRRRGDAFTVWFGLVNRLAPFGLVEDDRDRGSRLVRRPFGSGLLVTDWRRSDLVLVAVATAAILFDGISQTQFWFDLVGSPSLPAQTVQLLLFLGAIAGAVVLVSQVVGIRALAAGLVPIALGYLVAHYFTALIFDGQRIVTILSDPFNVGWDLFGTASFEPDDTFAPYGLVWAVELVAVVGGHVYGALMGHRAALLESPPGARGPFADIRARQVPLAVLMVALTTLTLWSLGQNLVQTAGEAAAVVERTLSG